MQKKIEKIQSLYGEIISLMKEGAKKERVISLLKEVVQAETKLYNEIYGSLNVIRADVVSSLMEQTLTVLKAQGIYHNEMVECLKGAMGSVVLGCSKGEGDK